MLYILITALLFNNIYSCSANYYENKLKTEILKDYNKFTIPSNKSLVNLQMGITVSKSPSIIGKTLFNKLSNWKIILEDYIK